MLFYMINIIYLLMRYLHLGNVLQVAYIYPLLPSMSHNAYACELMREVNG